MIRLVNVNKYFNKRKSNEIHVINNTSIELEDKGLVTFLGNSGCGKTTLLNAIGGLDKVNNGEIYIDDEKLTGRLDGKKDEIRNAYIGYIFQNYNLIEDKTVFFNVEIVLRMMGIKDKEEIKRRVLFILDKVGIEKYKNRPVKALSGGERQRVGIARALVKNPKIIIADEPTGNLDSRNTIEIMNIIKAISKERLVILVTHERELAEFYASRIIEIVDGKIISDKLNDHNNELDYRLENKIYLKDLPVQSCIEQDNVKIDYYSDDKEKNIDIKVVVKNNNIYIELPKGFREGGSTTELIDDHYQKISKEVYEDYKFDYDAIVGNQKKVKYTSIFNWGKVLINGYKKVFSYSIIKKILLLGFVLASIFTIYSVSNIAAITNITDDKFLQINKNYIIVEAGKISPELYKQYSEMDGIDFIIPGDSKISISMPLNDYYQSSNGTAGIDGSLADKAMLTQDKLIAGTMPKAQNEIALDKMLIKKLLDQGDVKQIGLFTEKDFIGRTVKGNHAGDLKIVAITDTGNPCVYMDSVNFFKVMIGNGDDDGQTVKLDVQDYNKELAEENIEVKKGRLPENDYEVMIPYAMADSTSIGKTIDTKVNGKKLEIVGFYTDKIHGREINFVNSNTEKYAFLDKCRKITLSPQNKEETYQQLKDESIKVTDVYNKDKKQYIENIKERVFSTILVAMIILIISLVEIYLILRSSFLSRIKEVGVLRAIGLKKRDVYKMFIGEIIAMTTITTLPTMLIAAYALEKLEGLPYIGEMIMMNPEIFLISLCIIFVANIIFGLLPVFNTMRKTPAAILSRNDVN